MKRSWIGFFLLLLLLGLGIFCTWAMGDIHGPVSEKLEQAAQAALERSWVSAGWLVRDARENWERWSLFRAALADHGPAEEIDALFSVLEVYESSRERVAFASLCREMAKKIQAIGDAHGLGAKNLL